MMPARNRFGPILGPCERSTAILSDRERQLLGREGWGNFLCSAGPTD